jgi:hypothetical protein
MKQEKCDDMSTSSPTPPSKILYFSSHYILNKIQTMFCIRTEDSF